jgi:hypothetical protein
LRQTVCRFSRCNTRCSCQKTFCARTLVARQATHSLPQGGRDSLPVLAGVRVSGAGEALIESAGNRGWAETCRMRDGDVERPWVKVKGWRCEPAFFAYFLCGGKESKCRPAQGQRWQTKTTTRMPASSKQNPTECPRSKKPRKPVTTPAP